MGAHAKAPSLVEAGGSSIPLNEWIAEDPLRALGAAASTRFAGRLPYLFKVLDVFKMLSIQAHPALPQAKAGFARENAAGIHLEATSRNYKDDSHKPEIGLALTEFWLLHGFRPLEQLADVLRHTVELTPLMPDIAKRLAAAGHDHSARRALLRELYSNAMCLPQPQVDQSIDTLLARLATQPAPEKSNPDYWALRAAESFPLPGGHRDRGIFSIYLLNLVCLQPGQGTFQPAGVLHAYLEGVNVELMANSDNVLRGGLTTKHVDVPELLNILTFEGGSPELLDGAMVSEQELVYRTPAQEFELSRIAIAAHGQYTGEAVYGPKTLIVLRGSATLTAAGQPMLLKRGAIVFACSGSTFTITTQNEDAILFQAGVPLHAHGTA